MSVRRPSLATFVWAATAAGAAALYVRVSPDGSAIPGVVEVPRHALGRGQQVRLGPDGRDDHDIAVEGGAAAREFAGEHPRTRAHDQDVGGAGRSITEMLAEPNEGLAGARLIHP